MPLFLNTVYIKKVLTLQSISTEILIQHCISYILNGLPDPKPEPICCFSFLPASYAFLPAVLGLDLGLHQATTMHITTI